MQPFQVTAEPVWPVTKEDSQTGKGGVIKVRNLKYFNFGELHY